MGKLANGSRRITFAAIEEWGRYQSFVVEKRVLCNLNDPGLQQHVEGDFDVSDHNATACSMSCRPFSSKVVIWIVAVPPIEFFRNVATSSNLQ